jgi:hypothetical protein
MTRRENLRNILRGGEGAWVPFCLNFKQWFDHHQRNRSLPKELEGGDYLDAQKTLDGDIFSRNLPGGFHWDDTRLAPRRESTETPHGTRSTTTYETPHGVLTETSQEQRAQSTSYTEAYPVKDPARDLKALLWLLSQREARWEEAEFLATDARIGDAGLLNVPVACSPIKALHLSFGLTGACEFAVDDPESAKTFCDLYWERVLPALRALAAHPKVDSVILMDNVDTPFYPPEFMRRYWVPYVRKASELLGGAGKALWVHACGQLKALSPCFAEAGVTGLEGVSHPPLGDWWVDEAQACHDGFIFFGGFSAAEQNMTDEGELTRFYANFFKRASRRRMIFGASCQTNIKTSWDRIRRVRDLVRAWGGSPT